jgi:hypothetical protein
MALALLLCAAFIASFALGLRGGPRSDEPALRPGAVADPAPHAGRVEVLNASGRGGVARGVTQRLREAGYDVVFFGNAGAALGDSTVVIARSGSDRVARAAARELEIARVVAQPDSTLFLDATVVLGVDWEPPAEPEEGAADEGWKSRLGRWLKPGR